MNRRQILGLLLAAGCESKQEGPLRGAVVRCAVIGGMMTTNFFPEVAKRFERDTGNKVLVVVSGNKRMIAPWMERGDADLITMHASDIMVNLVADGYAVDPEPWARNDHVIVGPHDDPAKIRGLRDAAAAMRRIVEAKSPFVIHRAGGTTEVLTRVLDDAGVALDDTTTLRMRESDNQENVLELASQKHAYSLVGFIPMKTGKMPAPGVEVLVEGDPRLRRPYLVAVANPKRWPAAHYQAGRMLAEYLRSPATQAWIADFAKSEFGGRAPFFPVTTP